MTTDHHTTTHTTRQDTTAMTTTTATDRPAPLRSYWANRPTGATHRTVERGVVHATAARDTDSWPSTLTTACGVTTAEQSSWGGDDTVTCRRCIRVVDTVQPLTLTDAIARTDMHAPDPGTLTMSAPVLLPAPGGRGVVVAVMPLWREYNRGTARGEAARHARQHTDAWTRVKFVGATTDADTGAVVHTYVIIPR